MAEKVDLKSAREELSLSQEEFARLFDVSPRTVIRWESGHSEPQGGAARKLQTFLGFLAEKQTAKEVREISQRPDGLELLKAMINQPLNNLIGNSLALGARSFSSRPGFLGVSPLFSGIVGGATSLWGAYKVLKSAFEKTPDADGLFPEGLFKCAVCQKDDKSQLLHCTGLLKDGQPCRFVACKGCIYSSREKHVQVSPQCNAIDVPSFEALEEVHPKK